MRGAGMAEHSGVAYAAKNTSPGRLLANEVGFVWQDLRIRSYFPPSAFTPPAGSASHQLPLIRTTRVPMVAALMFNSESNIISRNDGWRYAALRWRWA